MTGRAISDVLLPLPAQGTQQSASTSPAILARRLQVPTPAVQLSLTRSRAEQLVRDSDDAGSARRSELVGMPLERLLVDAPSTGTGLDPASLARSGADASGEVHHVLVEVERVRRCPPPGRLLPADRLVAGEAGLKEGLAAGQSR